MRWTDPMTVEERLLFIKRIDDQAFISSDRKFIVVECGYR